MKLQLIGTLLLETASYTTVSCKQLLMQQSLLSVTPYPTSISFLGTAHHETDL
jgi:hypothetical protein